jgi:hypothetical protein
MGKRVREHEADIADFLPLYVLCLNFIYHLHITGFSVVSKVVVHSRYMQTGKKRRIGLHILPFFD